MLIRFAVLIATVLTCAVLATPASGQRHRSLSVQQIICIVFGPHCIEAINVARCESHFDIWARNGQYLGIFQMGAHERSRYGQGWNAWAQALAAHRYFLVSGWAPWQCKPW